MEAGTSNGAGCVEVLDTITTRRNMKKIIGLLFWALGVAGVLAEDTNEVAIYKLLGERGQEIKAHIAAYDNTTNLDEIGTAWWKSRTLQSTNLAMWDAKLHLDVELLSRCLAGVNKTFDETKAKVYMNSRVPPLDPEARKKVRPMGRRERAGSPALQAEQDVKDVGRGLPPPPGETRWNGLWGGGTSMAWGQLQTQSHSRSRTPQPGTSCSSVRRSWSKKRAEEQGWGRTPGPPK